MMEMEMHQDEEMPSIDSNADKNARREREGVTPDHDSGEDAAGGAEVAAGVEATRALLERFTRTTAMCWAAAEGDLAMMQRLLAHGASVNDVNAADYDKRTPLHIAVSDNQEAAVEFLLQRGALTDTIDRWGRSPIDCAKETKNARILLMLQRVRYGTATSNSKHSAMASLFRKEGRDNSGDDELALHRSRSQNDIHALFRAVEEGDTERVKRVWLDGLQLDSVDAQGRTSLHVAVENAQLGVIELLLSADVDTTIADASGRTPISIALDKGLLVIAEILRAHQRATAAIQAKSSEDQQYVAQAFEATRNGTLAEVKRLTPGFMHPDVQDYDLRTLLHIASAEGHIHIVKYLVSCGANVNLLDRWGTSPLSEAIDFAHNDVARFLTANHATASGNRTAIVVDQIDNATLSSALEFSLRVVARKRWLMGQVFCPMQDDCDACVLVAHSVWHRNDSKPIRRNLSNRNFPSSPPSTPTLSPRTSATPSTWLHWKDPIQMFRKISSLMMVDPGQGHTGRVFSGQNPEWLRLNNAQQTQLFLLPHARRAGIQTIISVPMVYKMTTIAVLSWYSDELIDEDSEELQHIQRLLRSVTILATLRQELLSADSTTSGIFHIPRFQYCQSLDIGITANGELLDHRRTAEEGDLEDTLSLALEWGLFDFVDKLAVSMSSEDHAAVISLLRSLVTMLRNGWFTAVFSETAQDERDQPLDTILTRCKGMIRSQWELLSHVRYYVMYLHTVSPVEGSIFTDVDRLVPTINKYFACGDTPCHDEDKDVLEVPSPPSTPDHQTSATEEKECVLCKFNVPGHIHPGRAPIPPTPTKRPIITSTTMYPAENNFFGAPDSPRSPVLREIDSLLESMEHEYENFDRKGSLTTYVWDGFKSAAFTSSELYDAIGASHDLPARRSTFGTNSCPPDPRKVLLDEINGVMQDSSCLISYDQLLALHAMLIPQSSAQAGVLRTTAAVGYASPRIYRVFLPVGEIQATLLQLLAAINTRARWQQRPLLCAYYAFAVLVFYIHPFHDGNGRCARIMGNLIAKKLGFPAIFRAADKTLQLSEFLHRAVVTMEIVANSRRQSRQARMLANRKENTSMWF